MAASSHGSHRMTINKVLEEIFAHRDCELSDEKSEDISEYNGSEEDDESSKEVKSFEEHDSPSASEDSESEEEEAAPNRVQ